MAIDKTGRAQMDENASAVPFISVEEAWFWFIAAQDAKNEGARIRAGQAVSPRPCEAIDILKIVERLYRQRRLLRDHLLVLRHYGRRKYAPDARRIKERKAFCLWKEALERMEPVLVRKGIVLQALSRPDLRWPESAMLYENTRIEQIINKKVM